MSCANSSPFSHLATVVANSKVLANDKGVVSGVRALVGNVLLLEARQFISLKSKISDKTINKISSMSVSLLLNRLFPFFRASLASKLD